MKKNSTKIKTTGANGYTLIEVVITMFITATVFVGVYALFAKAMNYDKEGQHEIIASELAQEGIEIIKNKKEKNEMDWAVWNGVDNLSDLTMDKDISHLSSCNPSLAYSDDGEIYGFECNDTTTMKYSNATKTFEAGCMEDCVGKEYTRECITTPIVTGELRVICEVSWISGVLNSSVATENKRTVKASLVLTDWER